MSSTWGISTSIAAGRQGNILRGVVYPAGVEDWTHPAGTQYWKHAAAIDYISPTGIAAYAVGDNTKVDIQLHLAEAENLREHGVTGIFTENNRGTLSLILFCEDDPGYWFPFGFADSLQCTITEVHYTPPYGDLGPIPWILYGDFVSPGSDTSKQKSIGLGSVSLTSSWSGLGPYTQTVTVTGATVTAASKVDLQPTAAQLAALQTAGVTALTVENHAGVLTAYALGAAPSAALTVQCTVTEVGA